MPKHPLAHSLLFMCPPGPERDIYLAQLAEADFLPIVVADTVDALERLSGSPPPEAAVLDLLPSPDLTWALVERLTATTAVIILTALIRPDGANRQTAWRLGCAAFVAKPCSPRQLAEVVVRVCNGERGIEITTYSV